jgi:hypothetical protein
MAFSSTAAAERRNWRGLKLDGFIAVHNFPAAAVFLSTVPDGLSPTHRPARINDEDEVSPTNVSHLARGRLHVSDSAYDSVHDLLTRN